MQMGSDGVQGDAQHLSYFLVGQVFLVEQDYHLSFDLTQFTYRTLERCHALLAAQKLFGVSGGVRQPVTPVLVGVIEGGVRLFLATPFPLILGHVQGDAIQVGRQFCIPPEAVHAAIEAQKYFLRQILEVLAAAGKPGEGAKHKRLVLPNHIFELRIPTQANLRL